MTLPQMLPFFRDHDGEAVFRKEIVIPKNQQSKDLVLSLGALNGLDSTYFNGVEVGHTDMTITKLVARRAHLPGKLVRAGQNVIGVRFFNPFGPGAFAASPGLSRGPNGDRSGRQSNGPRIGLEMSLAPKPHEVQSLSYYYPEHRTDFHMGHNPYRYYRW